MLGWRILSHGEYRLDLPELSREEQELVLLCHEKFRIHSRLSGDDQQKETDKPGTKQRTDMERVEKIISKIIDESAEELGCYLDLEQKNYLSQISCSHICSFGFFDILLEDDSIEEIAVIGPHRPVYVYIRNAGWKAVNACFEDERAIANVVNKMARGIGRHITIQNPRLDAMLPDGSRLHASLYPISPGEITIRKFRERPFSIKELFLAQTIDIDAVVLLSVVMQCGLRVGIGGNTASGKTTTLNALFPFIPGTERVIITEETPEINVMHKHQLKLVANREMGISLKDLIYDTLRMRPDRMIIGEVRSKDEVEALFDVMLAGQARGCYATFHAQSAAEALARFRAFGIQEQDLRCLDCIAIQRRRLVYDTAKRRHFEVRELVEISEFGSDGRLHTVLQKHPAMAKQAGVERIKFDKIGLVQKAAQELGLTMKEMECEIDERKMMLEDECCPAAYAEFCAYIQKTLYGGRDNQKED